MIDWNSRWKDFLIGQGAVIDDSGVRHFAVPDPHAQSRLAANADIVADLSHLALIHAHGPDATAFLQGQLSNDIHGLDTGHSQLSAYCDPKGRVLALFRVFAGEQGYYLQLPAVLQADTLKRLKLFVLRAKLALDNVDRALIRIGLSGPNAERLLAEIVPHPPARTDESLRHEGIMALHVPGPFPRFELVTNVETAERVWRVFSARASTVGASAWSWLDIAAVIPTVLPSTAAEFIPQMLNLDVLGGVNFQKGCYPGQEIVARVHHRGRVTHRLYGTHASTDSRPLPGNPIFGDSSDQAAGWVVDAQPGPEGGFDLSVVVPTEPPSVLRLGNPQGPLLTLQKPPYFQVVS